MKPTLTIGTQYATMTDRESGSVGRGVVKAGEVTRDDASTAPTLCLAPQKAPSQEAYAGNGPPVWTHSCLFGAELDNSWGFCVGFRKRGLEKNVAFVRRSTNCFCSEEDPVRMRKGSRGLPVEFARSRGFRGARRPQGIRTAKSFGIRAPGASFVVPGTGSSEAFWCLPSGVRAVWTGRLSTWLA